MSQWRLIVKALSDGPATSGQLEFLGFNPQPACQRAKQLGLIQVHGRPRHMHWSLTERGRDYLDGRLTLVEAEGGIGRPAHKLAATWLASLPRATA